MTVRPRDIMAAAAEGLEAGMAGLDVGSQVGRGGGGGAE